MRRLGVCQNAVVVILLLGASGCGSGGGGSGDQGALYPAYEISAGTNPWGLAAADVDGDGRNDLIAASRADEAVIVLLSNGDGTFQTGVPFPMGASPIDVVAADVDGDGDADLVTVDVDTSYTIDAILGAGDGTFGAPQASEILIQPWFGLVSGDVNGDGLPDVITSHIASFFGQVASVFLSNGDGTFAETPREFTYTSGFESQVDAADLNGDEILDLVVNLLFDTTFIYLGNGDGTFQPPVTLSIPGFPVALLLTDVDTDTIQDIVTYGADDTIRVLFGTGDGGFEAPLDQPTDYNLFGMETVFLNDDLFPDVVLHGSDFLAVLLGGGDGTFEDAGIYLVGSVFEIAFLDANRDGNQDIAMTDGLNDVVKVVLGNGDGTFNARRFIPLDEENEVRDVKLGDFDADGMLDLIALRWNDEQIQFWRGDGTGNFELVSTDSLLEDPDHVLIADLNGDEVLDLVVLTDSGVQAYLGGGDGSFDHSYTFDTDDIDEAATIGDLNADEVPDLLFAVRDAVIVLPGVGDGTFSDPVPYPAEINRGDVLAVDDFNDDGFVDVAFQYDDKIFLLPGNGDGTLQEQVLLVKADVAELLMSGDFNRDGLPDLLFTTDNDALRVDLNQSGGVFVFADELQVPENPLRVSIADLNNDNRLDIVTKRYSEELYVFLGNGDGTFQDLQTFRLSESENFEIGDVNGDQRADIVSLYEGNDNDEEGIVVLLHR